MTKIDVHNYQKRWDNSIRNLQEDKRLSKSNRDLIQRFLNELVAKGLSIPRINRYMDTLRLAGRVMNKEFNECKKDDLIKFVSHIQTTKYSPWTRQMYKVMIRRFYCWLRNSKPKEYPQEVAWISIALKRNELKTPVSSELITPKDVEKLIDNVSHPRDKALISVLYEGGVRIGELASMSVKDIFVDEHGVRISVVGKTGPRKIRLISSTPHLMNWLNSHPFKNESNAALWVNIGSFRRNGPMKYNAITKAIRQSFRLAGINKPCNPHIFRHSRATFMAKYLTEFQMCKYFGWSPGSKMPSVYVHLSGRDLDESILELHGIKIENKESGDKPEPKICSRCGTINTHDATYCSKCAGFVDQAKAVQAEEDAVRRKADTNLGNEVMNKLMENPKIQEAILSALKELDTSS